MDKWEYQVLYRKYYREYQLDKMNLRAFFNTTEGKRYFGLEEGFHWADYIEGKRKIVHHIKYFKDLEDENEGYEERLNRLGKDGWEFISALYLDRALMIEIVLKRQDAEQISQLNSFEDEPSKNSYVPRLNKSRGYEKELPEDDWLDNDVIQYDD